MTKLAKRRRSPRLPNYLKLLLASREGQDHPIDLAVRERIQAEAAEKRIRRLQRSVRNQLGKKGQRALTALEDASAELSDARAEAFFNLGFEHGLLEGAARVSRVASEQEQQLAADLRERIAQAQLPPDKAALVAHDVLGAVLQSVPGKPYHLALEAAATLSSRESGS
jgi:hypothetical protein